MPLSLKASLFDRVLDNGRHEFQKSKDVRKVATSFGILAYVVSFFFLSFWEEKSPIRSVCYFCCEGNSTTLLAELVGLDKVA